MTDRELMRIHIETLFTHDDAGRMIRVNEPMGKTAPRFFLGRTTEGNEWRFRHDVDEDLVRELNALCTSEGDGDEFLLPPYGSSAYVELLGRTAPVLSVWTGPAFRFPSDVRETSETVLVTAENVDVLRPHFTAWLDDVPFCQPFLALLQNGRAVSVCGSVRVTPVAHEAGLETRHEFRGRGYAVQVVSAWARSLRDIGRIPLYSTSWQNTASQAVAAKLGLVRYGTTLHIT